MVLRVIKVFKVQQVFKDLLGRCPRCSRCSQGVQGAQGVQGTAGAQGNQGVQGASGTGGVGISSGGTVIGTGVTTLNFIGTGTTVVVSGTTASISSAGGANVSISTDAPSGPNAGDLWWDSDVGELFVYYDDGTAGTATTDFSSVTLSGLSPSSFNQTYTRQSNGFVLILEQLLLVMLYSTRIVTTITMLHQRNSSRT